MFTLVKLALRNLRRNRRRTIITVAAVSGGVGLFIASINLGNGTYVDMIDKGVATMAGHVVVQGKGFQEKRDPEIFLADAAKVRAELEALFPDAKVVPRTFLGGLLNSPTNSVGVGVTAIDPVVEPEVSDWETKLVEGAWLDADPSGILVGKALAESLQVGIGDKVVLMAQGEDDVNSRLFRVKGIFRSGSTEADGFLTLIPLAAAEEVHGRPDSVTQLSLHLPDPDDTPAATARVAAALDDPGREVLDWKRALPEIWQLIQVDAQSNNAFLVVMGLMVALGVLNTILMSVMERIREFGVLLALGVTPLRIAAIILLEGLLLGIGSVALGCVLGALLTWPMISVGIDMSAMMGGDNYEMGGVALSTRIFAAWDYTRCGAIAAFGVLFCVLAAIYPALRAARLKPVDAMHHV